MAEMPKCIDPVEQFRTKIFICVSVLCVGSRNLRAKYCSRKTRQEVHVSSALAELDTNKPYFEVYDRLSAGSYAVEIT